VVNAPTQTASHTYASAGTYTVSLTAKDTGGLMSSPATKSITVSAGTVTTVESRVAASADDAEQTVSNGSVNLTSSDLELIQDSSNQVVGMRWPGLAIPQGATITAAWIQFVSKEAWSVATSLTLKAQAADNAGTFTSTTSNVSSRPVTNNGASWVPVAWAVGDAGANQKTPDLSAVVQEVVSRPGWTSGNALAIIVNGSGHRTAWAYDGSPTQAPLLHVEFTSNGSQPPPTDNPPVAKLAVSQAASPPLTVSASGAGSTDSDQTPIASYSFTWGDGSSATAVNAPTQTATHTYSSAGTYTVTLTAKDTGGLTSSPVTASVTVTPPSGGGGGNVAVYVGYYDTHHPSYTKTKPSPWLGASGVTFVGKDDDGKGNWDSSALRVDNLTGSSMTVTVTCDIGSNHYALWGSRTIPANGMLIMAQTAFQNFDGSDTSPAGCYGCDPKLCLTQVVSTIPVIHVTAGGTTTNYYDNTQVLNTKGADGAGCPDTGGTRNDESQQWKQIGTTQSLRDGDPADENWVPQQMTFDAPAPNPVRDWMVIRYSIPKASRVFVGFYDVAGRLVSIVLDREMPAGIFQQGVTLGNVNPGVYYCQVQTAYGTVHRSVVVSR
jgi:PKD repeat protein